MPFLTANGIRLCYERQGGGEPVLLIMGSGAAGRVWTMHQTPALTAAGYQAVTFDNRGIAPSDVPPGRYSLAEMVADTVGLIEGLELGPCRVVGASLGAMIAQEIALHRSDLVRSAVLIATRARSDVARAALGAAWRVMEDSGIRLPAEYDAAMQVIQMLSPSTLNDEPAARSWLDVFEISGGRGDTAGGQLWATEPADRRAALRDVTVPCRVISFADDLICPPLLGAEVAEAIPGCDQVVIDRAGHLGYLERPEETNAAIIEFLDKY